MERFSRFVLVGALILRAANPAKAGNITLTGHDDDLHHAFGSVLAGAQLSGMISFARAGSPNPTLPVLTFDAGTQLTSSLGSLGIPFTNVNPNAGVPAASLFNVSTFSAFVVASDTTCGGCDNDSTSSTNIKGASGAIKSFVNAGGGIVGLAGATNSDYYSFLPASASGFGSPPSEPYVQTAFGASLGIPAVNGDPTHNFFFEPGTGGVDPLYGVVERFSGTIVSGGVSFVDPAETIALAGAIIGDGGFVPPSTVPEPGTLFLFGTTAAGLLARWRRRKLLP
jgi:PEP-CTERM motif